MLLKIGAIVAAVPLSMVGVVAGTGVVVVDVKEKTGQRIVVPVPLVLAQFAANLAPTRATDQALRGLEKAEQFIPMAEEVVAALAEAPDAELVSVDDGDEHVRIVKRGDLVEIRVDGRRETVRVNVPLPMVQDALRQVHHKRINPARLVGLLREARMTDIVEVEDHGGDHVKITVW